MKKNTVIVLLAIFIYITVLLTGCVRAPNVEGFVYAAHIDSLMYLFSPGYCGLTGNGTEDVLEKGKGTLEYKLYFSDGKNIALKLVFEKGAFKSAELDSEKKVEYAYASYYHYESQIAAEKKASLLAEIESNPQRVYNLDLGFVNAPNTQEFMLDFYAAYRFNTLYAPVVIEGFDASSPLPLYNLDNDFSFMRTVYPAAEKIGINKYALIAPEMRSHLQEDEAETFLAPKRAFEELLQRYSRKDMKDINSMILEAVFGKSSDLSTLSERYFEHDYMRENTISGCRLALTGSDIAGIFQNYTNTFVINYN